MATPTIESINTGIQDLLKRIQTEGVTGTKGEVLLAPQKLQTTPTGQINPIITADQLQAPAPKPIDLTGAVPSLTSGATAGAMVAGATEAQKSIADYLKLLVPEETTESKRIKELVSQAEGLLPKAEGRGAAQLEAETLQDIPGKRTALTAVQGQISSKIAEFNKIEADYMKAVEATERVPGTTTGIVAGQQRQLARDLAIQRVAYASEVGMLNAVQSNLRGDLELAQSQADRAISLKYQDIQDSINIRLQQIQLIQPELNKQEKLRADAIQMYLTSQQTAVNDAKKAEQQLINYNLDSMSKYPSAQINIKDSYQITQQKILNSREYKLATTPTPTTNIPEPIPGQPIPEQPIISLTGKPLTDTQSTALGYAQRMNDANKIISDLGGKFTGVLSYISGSGLFPNILKSDDRQNYEQAQRNFINAVLRKESGAAISPSEFDSAAKQYFPQPGDNESVIAQKTSNRTRVINNLLQSANVSQSVLGGGTTGDYESYLNAIGE